MRVAVPEPAHETVSIAYVFCTEVVCDYWLLILVYAAYPPSAMTAALPLRACRLGCFFSGCYRLWHARQRALGTHTLSSPLGPTLVYPYCPSRHEPCGASAARLALVHRRS